MKEVSLSAYDDYEYMNEGENSSEGLFSPFTYLCFSLIIFLMGIVTLYSSSFEKCIYLGLQHFLMLKLQLFGVGGGLLAGLALCFLPRKLFKKIHFFLFFAFICIVTSCFMFPSFAEEYDLASFVGVVGAVTIVFQLSDSIPIIRKSELMGIPLLASTFCTCLVMVFSMELTGSGWFLLDALIVLSIMNTYGIKKSYIAFVGLFFLVTFVFLNAYFLPQFQSFTNAFLPVYETDLYSQEIYVSRMAIRDGGLLGIGLGRGISKLGLLTSPEGEYILTTLLEETGIIGFLPYLLSLFIVFVIGIRTVNRSRKKEDEYVAASVMGMIVFVVFASVFCMMRTVGLNPFGGVLLPFFSFNPVYEGICLATLCVLYKYIYMMGRSQKHEK